MQYFLQTLLYVKVWNFTELTCVVEYTHNNAQSFALLGQGASWELGNTNIPPAYVWNNFEMYTTGNYLYVNEKLLRLALSLSLEQPCYFVGWINTSVEQWPLWREEN